MPASLPNHDPIPLLPRAETPEAKHLRLAEEYRVLLGAAIRRARLRLDWSLKELAGHVDRDERQVARWERGDERPHWDALFALDLLRPELIVALAELGGGTIAIETTVRVRRTT